MLVGGQRSREAVVPRLMRGIHYVVVLRVCVVAARDVTQVLATARLQRRGLGLTPTQFTNKVRAKLN